MVTSMIQDGLPLASFVVSDEHAALTTSVAAFTRQLFQRAAISFMGAEGDGPLALHRALATILHEPPMLPR